MSSEEGSKFLAIRREIEAHPSNAWAQELDYKPVYSASKTSRIVIVGQAPGKKAQESHIPWNDVSGKRLREWLGISDDVFYDDSQVALIPMDFYFPGSAQHGDKPPRKDFAPMWHPRLLELMPDVQLIIVIGQYAQKYYLGDNMKRNLTETVRSYKEFLPDYMPLVHSSPLNFRWIKKNPWFEAEVVPQLQKLVSDILSKK